MKTSIMEQGSDRLRRNDATMRHPVSEKRPAAGSVATEQAEAAMERQIADFQRTFSARWEW